MGLEATELFVSTSETWLPRLRGIIETRLRRDLHGGEMETSLMLWVRPDLVNESWRFLPATEVDLIDTVAAGLRFKDVGPGYFGAPALASPEKGEKIMALMVSTMAQAVREFMSRSGV